MLDGDALAAGKPFYHLGDRRHSDDHRLLAWSCDETGSEFYTIRIRDLRTREDLPDVIPDASGDVVWDQAGSSFLYVVIDESHRPRQVKRHVLGTPPASDSLVYDEREDGWFVHLEESQSGEPQPIRFGLPSYDEQGRRLPDVEKTLKVRIPPGVVDGERIRLKGQGAPGVGGAPAGDLYLIIRLAPHPLFDIDGRNLVLSVPLAPWEAALGAKIEVPTLNGGIALSVPPGSQSGQRLRIRGKGLAGKGEDPAGDLYAVLKVVMPKGAPEGETRKHWEELAARAAFDPRSQWGKRP